MNVFTAVFNTIKSALGTVDRATRTIDNYASVVELHSADCAYEAQLNSAIRREALLRQREALTKQQLEILAADSSFEDLLHAPAPKEQH